MVMKRFFPEMVITPIFLLISCAAPADPEEEAKDPAAILVSRLSLERYKDTIKGLTQFGDRRQGTPRNR